MRRIELHWVPGHVGIQQNEAIDAMAKEAAEMAQPRRTTFSVARENLEATALRKWHTLMRDTGYSGHHSLIKSDEHVRVKAKAKQHWWIRSIGGASAIKNTGQARIYARATRLISGHMPIGEYRQRFHLEGRTHCVCGKPDTREHMLNDCPIWIRPWRPIAPLTLQEQEFLEGTDPIDRRSLLQPFGREEIYHFLLLNPMAGTFEWAELCDKRDADLASCSCTQHGRTSHAACSWEGDTYQHVPVQSIGIHKLAKLIHNAPHQQWRHQHSAAR